MKAFIMCLVSSVLAGCVPEWLQGTLLRNGPGLFNVGATEYNHWFDGMALIHSFTFKDGETGTTHCTFPQMVDTFPTG